MTEDGVKHEKNWTKNLKTDDQTVLRTAKEAQKMEKKALSRFEGVQLTGTTTVGVDREGFWYMEIMHWRYTGNRILQNISSVLSLELEKEKVHNE